MRCLGCKNKAIEKKPKFFVCDKCNFSILFNGDIPLHGTSGQFELCDCVECPCACKCHIWDGKEPEVWCHTSMKCCDNFAGILLHDKDFIDYKNEILEDFDYKMRAYIDSGYVTIESRNAVIQARELLESALGEIAYKTAYSMEIKELHRKGHTEWIRSFYKSFINCRWVWSDKWSWGYDHAAKEIQLRIGSFFERNVDRRSLFSHTLVPKIIKK